MPPSCALLGGFAICARVALLWQHYRNAWQSPAVIRQAHRMSHACRTRTLRMPAKTPLAGDITSTRLLRASFHFVHTAGCCKLNSNAKCQRVHACTRSMPSCNLSYIGLPTCRWRAICLRQYGPIASCRLISRLTSHREEHDNADRPSLHVAYWTLSQLHHNYYKGIDPGDLKEPAISTFKGRLNKNRPDAVAA